MDTSSTNIVGLGQLLEETARRNVCTYEDLLQLATWWLITHSQGREGLDEAIDKYANLRNQGYGHREAKEYIRAMHIVEGKASYDFSIAECRNKNNREIIREDKRLIRDD